MPRHVSAIPRPCSLLGVSTLLLLACAGSMAGERADATTHGVGASILTRGDFHGELLLTGELQAVRSVAVKSPQTSLFQLRITFMAEEGSAIQKGEPLLEFDNSSVAARVLDLETQILDVGTQLVEQQAALASALEDLRIELAERRHASALATLEASVDPEVLSRKEQGERQLRKAQAERSLDETVERTERTREQGQADVDVLQIRLDRLKSELLKAEQDLALLSIEAPADGLVVYDQRQDTTLRYQEGDSCWPGQGILRLPDLSAMKVVFFVSEVDAPLLAEGQRLEVSLDAFPGRPLDATITHLPSMAVKRSETSRLSVFKVEAELSETWHGDMKPGMSVRGRLVLDERADVPLVDRRHVVHATGGGYAVRRGDGTLVPVEPVARNATHYVLSEADWGRLASGASS